MSAEMDALTVVNQLRDLAADPLNRRAIVEDQGCLPGLILFLDHPNPQVVYSALLAVRYLAECRANREKMKSELGMMLSLQNKNPSRNINGFTAHSSGDVALKEVVCRLMKWENVVNGETFSFSGMNTSPGETKLLASEIYEILQAAGNEEAERAEGEASSCKRKAHFFLGSSNKRAKTVVLHIDGLDDPFFPYSAFRASQTRRSLCEEALLKIRGVISFTFQMAVKRCVVRIRSDLKADLMVPFQEDSAAVVEENTDIPDYLPEEESPSQEQDKAVTRIGSVTEGMGWLSTAANFLTRSFYW
ncbi:hypothetical protein fugu_015949 [Takifugu bimaculatus]|uniref:Armadillo repeat-containing protein 1 n=1 Tax=Takifugu bimaculatus TaxID=433685 RepID=A0A4Z2BX24_9TELE|nr:hypothetical protein fugu_015949 [Takifugu bimaculatus]